MNQLHRRIGWINVLLVFCLVFAYFNLNYIIFWLASTVDSALVFFFFGMLLILVAVALVLVHFVNAVHYWRGTGELDPSDKILLAAGGINACLLLLMLISVLT